jgi:hypothetical protein
MMKTKGVEKKKKEELEHLRLKIKREPGAGWWLTPIILATQEAEIRRITIRS